MTTTESYTGIDDLTVTLDDGVLVGDAEPAGQPQLADGRRCSTTIADALERAATDPAVRVVRLGGAGRGFSSGAGISAEDHANPDASGAPDDVLAAANRAIRAIVALPKPVVVGRAGPRRGRRRLAGDRGATSSWPRRRPISCWRSPRLG